MNDPIQISTALALALLLVAWCVYVPKLVTAAARCADQFGCQHEREAAFYAQHVPTGDHW